MYFKKNRTPISNYALICFSFSLKNPNSKYAKAHEKEPRIWTEYKKT